MSQPVVRRVATKSTKSEETTKKKPMTEDDVRDHATEHGLHYVGRFQPRPSFAAKALLADADFNYYIVIRCGQVLVRSVGKPNVFRHVTYALDDLEAILDNLPNGRKHMSLVGAVSDPKNPGGVKMVHAFYLEEEGGVAKVAAAMHEVIQGSKDKYEGRTYEDAVEEKIKRGLSSVLFKDGVVVRCEGGKLVASEINLGEEVFLGQLDTEWVDVDEGELIEMKRKLAGYLGYDNFVGSNAVREAKGNFMLKVLASYVFGQIADIKKFLAVVSATKNVGKSHCRNVFAELMGHCAKQVDSTRLAVTPSRDAEIRNADVVQFCLKDGGRILVVDEVSGDDQRLDQSYIKKLSDEGAPIQFRDKQKTKLSDVKSFKPMLALMLFCNHFLVKGKLTQAVKDRVLLVVPDNVHEVGGGAVRSIRKDIAKYRVAFFHLMAKHYDPEFKGELEKESEHVQQMHNNALAVIIDACGGLELASKVDNPCRELAIEVFEEMFTVGDTDTFVVKTQAAELVTRRMLFLLEKCPNMSRQYPSVARELGVTISSDGERDYSGVKFITTQSLTSWLNKAGVVEKKRNEPKKRVEFGDGSKKQVPVFENCDYTDAALEFMQEQAAADEGEGAGEGAPDEGEGEGGDSEDETQSVTTGKRSFVDTSDDEGRQSKRARKQAKKEAKRARKEAKKAKKEVKKERNEHVAAVIDELITNVVGTATIDV
jgi:hypothetical protein